MGRRRRRKTQLVELTSKPLKLQLALSVIVLVGGILIAIGAGESPAAALGMLAAVFGFVWHIVTRIRVWWHHG